MIGKRTYAFTFLDMKHYLLLYLLFLSALLAAQANLGGNGEHAWTRTNPGGGGAFGCIGAGPTGMVVVGSDLSGAYKSVNQGASWIPLGAAQGLSATHVSGVGFHPTNGNLFFLGTEEGLFRTANGGATFTQPIVSGYVTDIKGCAAAPTRFYAARHPFWNATQGEVYRSNDSGVTWWQVSTNLPDDVYILKLLVHPTNADIVYVLTGRGRFACGPAQVYRSANGGSTWTNITTALGQVLDVAIHPSSPSTLYVTTMNANCANGDYSTDFNGKFYKSTNEGVSWTQQSAYTGVIWIKKDAPSVIRLIDPRTMYHANAGTWRSSNEGATWTKIGDPPTWETGYIPGKWAYSINFNGIVSTLGEDMSNSDRLYWCTTQWVFSTSNGGATFRNLHTKSVGSGWQSTGCDNIVMQELEISRANDAVMYAGFWDIGMWRSLDRGLSWQACNDSIFTGNWKGYGGNTRNIVADPTRANVVWATQQGDFYQPSNMVKSVNYGAKGSWTWSGTGLPSTPDISGLSLDRSSAATNRRLFVTADGDVYRSTNDGATWTKVFENNGMRLTAVDKNNGNLVYAGGEFGLYRSTDGGNTWHNISHPEMYGKVNAPLWDWEYTGIFDLYTELHRNNWLYVAVYGAGKGLYRSMDMGATWEKLLTDNHMRTVTTSPKTPGLIYAGSSRAYFAGRYEPTSNGIRFSKDFGYTWQYANDGMAYPFALTMDMDQGMPGKIFVGVPGTGFQYASAAYALSVGPYSQRFAANATNGTVYIESNLPNWTIGDDATWCTLSTASGAASAAVNAIFQPNTSATVSRTAKVTVSGYGQTRNVLLTQASTNGTTCVQPGNQWFSNLTNTSVQLNWDWMPGNGTFTCQIRPVGAVGWTFSGDVNTNSKTVTGLRAGVQYEWRVRAICGSNSTTNYTAFQRFYTPAFTEVAGERTAGADGFAESVSFADLRIFPNPSTDLFQLRFMLPAASDLRLEVYDMTGKMLFSRAEYGAEGENLLLLHMEEQVAGVYRVALRNASGSVLAQGKVVKM